LNFAEFPAEENFVNPVRNSSGALSLAGMILKCNPAAELLGILSNGVNISTKSS
jgi:hypothetical protein